MKLCIQRVKEAIVSIDGKEFSRIGKGLLVFLGISDEDDESVSDYIIKKLYNLRIFEDENGKMNLSVKDVNGELMIVSQFTLHADCSNGNRPSFSKSAKFENAKKIYDDFISKCRMIDKVNIATGEFGADMKISLINDGPVTIILEND